MKGNTANEMSEFYKEELERRTRAMPNDEKAFAITFYPHEILISEINRRLADAVESKNKMLKTLGVSVRDRNEYISQTVFSDETPDVPKEIAI